MSPTPSHRQYPGALTDIKIGTEYAAALFEGKILLHTLDHPDSTREDKESCLFPEPSLQEAAVMSHFINSDFLAFVTDLGHLQYFALEEWKIIVRYRHPVGFKAIFCDPAGTRAIIVDVKNNAHVFNPINNEINEIPQFPSNYSGVLWDLSLTDRNVFTVFNNEIISTYYFTNQSITGSHVDFLSSTLLPKQQIPLVFFHGELFLHNQGGRLNKIVLSSHETAGLLDIDPNTRLDNQRMHLKKLLSLQCYNEAWEMCKTIDEKECWIELGESAIGNLEILFALRVYTLLDDVAMVWSLEKLLHVENTSALCAGACVCLDKADSASAWSAGLEGSPAGLQQQLQLLSLRLALRHWEQAAHLAAAVAPHKMPSIQRNHAQHLEFTGDYHEALSTYEKGLIEINESDTTQDINIIQEHNKKCLAGIARTSIRCGDTMRGVAIATELSDNVELMKECALLLENAKQYGQAAALYDQAGAVDKAALLYIKLKSWLKVEPLLSRVTLPKIHLQYGKAKEADGRYAEALKAYKLGKDYDSAIRLNLDHLNNPDEAVEIVQETKSIQGAKLVALFFQRLNDYTTAIKFLIMSLCYEEAFQLARHHGKLQLFGEILIQNPDGRLDDFKSLALHFEGEKNSLLAGKFYFHANEYSKAMTHLLKAASNPNQENEAISLAIDTIASSGDDVLAKQLIRFLLGDSDGFPKDPKYLFRLYMARKQFQEAAKTAVIIANQEQVNGNYRVAHDMLFTMHQELRANGLTVPAEMKASLALLHSYILVRLHLKRGDHVKCANMLNRVAENISLFPSHIVSILTSAVIECHRAGLKKSALVHAKTLMRPEYRSQIDPKYTKKIESVVRHPPKEAERQLEEITPCPYCGHALPATNLVCNQCQMSLPFCIATGYHIIKSDLTACPECDFPAIKKYFDMLAEEGLQCPMCWEKLDISKIHKVDNAQTYLHDRENKY